MISSTSLLSAPSMIGGAHPAGGSDVPAGRPHLPSPTGRRATPPRPALVPPPPMDSGLVRFLRQPGVELAMLHDLEPPISAANLQDPSTFDAVLQRSRRRLRDAAAQGGQDSAILQAALQVLDRNVVLRSQSWAIRNALYQG